MNLRSSINKVGRTLARLAAAMVFKTTPPSAFMFSAQTVAMTRIKPLTTLLAAALPFMGAFSAGAQTNVYSRYGTEFAVVGSLPGDQVFPDVALSSTGGFVVWQDNATDADGWGISASRLDSTLSAKFSPFRINVTGAGNQENPRVAMLKNGGAAFVWQGGKAGFQHVYARYLTPTNTFLATNDLLVSSSANNFQINPNLAVLNNSNVVVVWSSYNQAGSNSMQDVYAKILSPSGTTLVSEFLVNQFTAFNQRTPSVAALAGGGFVVSWVSEQQTKGVGSTTNSTYLSASTSLNPSIDIYARAFNATGGPVGSEFKVNTDNNLSANPVVAAATDGSYLISWTSQDLVNPLNNYDIFGRVFSANHAGGTEFYVNSTLLGDQYQPRISGLGLDYLVTWTSMGQDGSREGVFGQFIHSDGSRVGGELSINTTTVNQQFHPAVAADGAGQFLVVWSGFNLYAPNNVSFDLFAQRYLNASVILQPMAAPFVWAPFVTSNNVYQPRLALSWAPLQGLSVSNYEVFVDGTLMASPVGTQWTMTASNGLAAGTTHTFQLDYVLADGRRPGNLSPTATGIAWQGYSWGGIPFEWMRQYYGDDMSQWPSATAKIGGNGLTLSQIFLSGGDPLNAATWLKTALSRTANGMFLTWNTQPGAAYQVQVTTNFSTWINLGTTRFAAGLTDSLYIGGSAVGYYRVLLVR